MLNCRNEKEEKLVQKNDELTSTKDRNPETRRNGEINPFDFHDIRQDNEIDINKILNIAENNLILYKNIQIINIITDAIRYSNLFILKNYIEVNDGDFHKSIDSFKVLINYQSQLKK